MLNRPVKINGHLSPELQLSHSSRGRTSPGIGVWYATEKSSYASTVHSELAHQSVVLAVLSTSFTTSVRNVEASQDSFS